MQTPTKPIPPRLSALCNAAARPLPHVTSACRKGTCLQVLVHPRMRLPTLTFVSSCASAANSYTNIVRGVPVSEDSCLMAWCTESEFQPTIRPAPCTCCARLLLLRCQKAVHCEAGFFPGPCHPDFAVAIALRRTLLRWHRLCQQGVQRTPHGGEGSACIGYYDSGRGGTVACSSQKDWLGLQRVPCLGLGARVIYLDGEEFTFVPVEVARKPARSTCA